MSRQRIPGVLESSTVDSASVVIATAVVTMPASEIGQFQPVRIPKPQSTAKLKITVPRRQKAQDPRSTRLEFRNNKGAPKYRAGGQRGAKHEAQSSSNGSGHKRHHCISSSRPDKVLGNDDRGWYTGSDDWEADLDESKRIARSSKGKERDVTW